MADWGHQDRSFLDRHPWAGRAITGAALLGGAVLGLRLAGPSLLRNTESFLLREFSSSISLAGDKAIVNGVVQRRTRVGILNQFARPMGVQVGANGQAIAPGTLLGKFAHWGAQQTADYRGFSHYQRQAFYAGGMTHLANGLGVDLNNITHEQAVAMRSALRDGDGLIQHGWLQDERYRALEPLLAHHGANAEMQLRTHLDSYKGEWANTVVNNPHLQSQEKFYEFMRQKAGGVVQRQNVFNWLIGGHAAPLTPQQARAVDPIFGEIVNMQHLLGAEAHAVDSGIVNIGEQLLDYRLTSHIASRIGKTIASNFQIPIVPGFTGFRPFVRMAGESGRLRPFETTAIGAVQPLLSSNDSGVLTQGAYISRTQGAYTVGATGEITQAYDGAIRRESPYSYLAHSYGKMLGYTNQREQPLTGILGHIASALDLFQQERPSFIGQMVGRISRLGDPNWEGNLAKRLWSDGADDAFSQAGEKVSALQKAFRQYGPLDDATAAAVEGRVGKELTDMGIGDINTMEGLGKAHAALARLPHSSVQDSELHYLLRSSFEELASSGGTEKFRKALLREGVLKQAIGDAKDPQQAIMDAIFGQTTSPLVGGALLGNLPGQHGEQSFVMDALLRNLKLGEDATSGSPQELIDRLRGPEGGIVKAHMEAYAWRQAYGMQTPYHFPGEVGQTAFTGSPVVAIPEGRLLPRARTREALTEWASSLWGGTPQNTTTATLNLFGGLERLNDRMEMITGLGLSSRSMGSVAAFAGNLLLKRALPIAAGAFYADYLSWEMRRFIHGGQADDEGKAPGFLTNARANMSLAGAWLGEKTGLVGVQKALLNYVPGLENYLHPRTHAEQQEYLASGYDPVRRGGRGFFDEYLRPRLLGRDPIYGGKIQHWQPNWYARAATDAEYSDSTLTRDEYYKHSWLPTPRHPFAPLNRLANMYHWEDRHQADRPYPASGDAFTPAYGHQQPIAAVGNALLGWLLKPRRVSSARDEVTANAEDLHTRAAERGGSVGGRGGVRPNASPTGEAARVAQEQADNGLLYTTPRGMQRLYSARAGTRAALADNAAELHGAAAIAANGPYEAYRRPTAERLLRQSDVNQAANPDIGGRVGDVARIIRRLYGIRGGAAVEALGLEHLSNNVQLEPAHHGYGGMRRADVTYLNERENTLPSWLPFDYMGRNPHVGDEMGRMPGGHYRLPGAGHEKLYKIKYGDSRPLPMTGLGLNASDMAQYMLGREVDIPESDTPNATARRQQIRDQFAKQQGLRGLSVDWHSPLGWIHLGGPSTPAGLDAKLPGGWNLHLLGQKYPYKKYLTPSNLLKSALALDVPLSFLPGKPWFHLLGTKFPGRRYVNSPSDVAEDLIQKATAIDVRSRLPGRPWLHIAGPKAPRRNYWWFQNAIAPDGYYPGWDQAVQGVGSALSGKLFDTLGMRVSHRPWMPPAERGAAATNVALNDPVHGIQGKADLLLEEHRKSGFWLFQKDHRSLIPVLMRGDQDSTNSTQDEAAAQFAAYMTGAPYTYLSYNTPQGQHLKRVKYNKKEMARIFRETNAAKAEATTMLNDPSIPKQEWYSTLDRFRVLADAYSYSDETDFYAKKLSETLDPDSKEWEQFQAIKDRMSQQKKQYQLYPYRFSRAREVTKKRVTIKEILDPNTFTTEEDPEHPIKLAGVRLSKSKMSGDWLRDLGRMGIRPGAKVLVLGDPTPASDQLGTTHGVVYSKGRNVNREALRRGYAREDRHKNSPSELFLYYGPMGRAVGGLIERLSHIDTPWGNKFLKVRSPLEEYKRGQLYGKSSASMSHPWRDWVVPTAESIFSHNPLYAGFLGGMAAGLFWRSPKGTGFFGGSTKRWIMGIAALAAGAISTGVHLSHGRDNPYIPSRRRKEWALKDYMDKLEYLKATRLYLKYRKKAYDEDGVDVDRVQKLLKQDVKARRRQLDKLSAERRRLKLSMGHGRVPKDHTSQKAELKQITKSIAELEQDSSLQGVSQNAAKAILYQRAAQKTMYGMPNDATVGERLAALPTKHRQIISEAMESSSQKEKAELARLLSPGERKVIGRYLDPALRSPQSESLVDYFRQHFLPRENWKGWDEDQDLKPVLAKEVNRMGLDPQEFAGLYNDEMRAGVQHPLATGHMDAPRSTHAADIREHLHRALAPYLDGCDVQVTALHHPHHNANVNMHVLHTREDELDDYLNEHRRVVL